MTLALIFAAVDLVGGSYLLRYGWRKERARREAVIAVGLLLVLGAGGLLGAVVHRQYRLQHLPRGTVTYGT